MQRLHNIDFVRGFAIILVILGHSIQYGSGEAYRNSGEFYNNMIFKFIYSFHMPLFIMLSGYLFCYTVDRYSTRQFIKNRIKRLLIPIISWGCIMFIITAGIQHKEFRLHLILSCIRYCIENNWFLWAVLISSFIVYFISHVFHDSLICYIVMFALLFITPDDFNFKLYKYIFPFFLIAYFFHKKESMYKRHRFAVGCFCIVAFLFLLSFYNRECYIYTTGFTLLGNKYLIKQFVIDIFRIAIGILGCMAILIILEYCYSNLSESICVKYIEQLGQHSMGIYLMSGIIMQYILTIDGVFTHHNILINFIQTIVILVVTNMGTIFLAKFKITDKIFLGGR